MFACVGRLVHVLEFSSIGDPPRSPPTPKTNDYFHYHDYFDYFDGYHYFDYGT